MHSSSPPPSASPLKRRGEHGGKDLVHVRGLAQCGKEALKNLRPGVDLIGAVVAVDHSHRLAGGGGHHVDLGIDLSHVVLSGEPRLSDIDLLLGGLASLDLLNDLVTVGAAMGLHSKLALILPSMTIWT